MNLVYVTCDQFERESKPSLIQIFESMNFYVKDKTPAELLGWYLVVRSDSGNTLDFKIVKPENENTTLFTTENGINYNQSIPLTRIYLDRHYNFDNLRGLKINHAIKLKDIWNHNKDVFSLSKSTLLDVLIPAHKKYTQEPIFGIEVELYESLKERPEGFRDGDPLYLLYQNSDLEWIVLKKSAGNVTKKMYNSGIVFAKKEYVERMIEFFTQMLPMSEDNEGAN